LREPQTAAPVCSTREPTRDAWTQDRAGEMFFEANSLDERIPSPEGDLFEVRFADGVWMLARTPDLTFFA
jgi:hypothetical protein